MSSSSKQCTNERKHPQLKLCWEKVNDNLWEDAALIYGDLCHWLLSVIETEELFTSAFISHLTKHGILKQKLARTYENWRRRSRNNEENLQRYHRPRIQPERSFTATHPHFYMLFEPITKFLYIKLKYPRGEARIKRRRNSKLTDLTTPRPSARDNNRTNQPSAPVNVMHILPKKFHVTTAHTQNCHSG